MTECNQSGFGFEACGSREIVARFDGGTISSDGGAFLLRQTDKRLNLLPRLAESAIKIDDVRMGVNYGLNRVRFPAPVPSGSRIRAHLKLLGYDAIDGGAQLVMQVTMERDGSDKPVCVAETVSRRYV